MVKVGMQNGQIVLICLGAPRMTRDEAVQLSAELFVMSQTLAPDLAEEAAMGEWKAKVETFANT